MSALTTFLWLDYFVSSPTSAHSLPVLSPRHFLERLFKECPYLYMRGTFDFYFAFVCARARACMFMCMQDFVSTWVLHKRTVKENNACNNKSTCFFYPFWFKKKKIFLSPLGQANQHDARRVSHSV